MLVPMAVPPIFTYFSSWENRTKSDKAITNLTSLDVFKQKGRRNAHSTFRCIQLDLLFLQIINLKWLTAGGCGIITQLVEKIARKFSVDIRKNVIKTQKNIKNFF